MNATEADQINVRIALNLDDHDLSKKEINFIESIGRWVLDRGIAPTNAQRKKLKEILNEHDRWAIQ